MSNGEGGGKFELIFQFSPINCRTDLDDNDCIGAQPFYPRFVVPCCYFLLFAEVPSAPSWAGDENEPTEVKAQVLRRRNAFPYELSYCYCARS